MTQDAVLGVCADDARGALEAFGAALAAVWVYVARPALSSM
ncbi:hypothetical protein AB0F44_02715 [Nocardioides sp. NPDC023903]